jgi:hypothetical protein
MSLDEQAESVRAATAASALSRTMRVHRLRRTTNRLSSSPATDHPERT